MATKKLSKKQLGGMLSNALKKEHARRNREESNEPKIESTGFICVVPRCKGEIVEETSLQYLGGLMDMPVGPVSENKYTRVRNLCCSHCGIAYHHLPKRRH